ncbi:hypothetical protein ACWCSH_45350, partial [Streptosporangium sp. NPDC001682]
RQRPGESGLRAALRQVAQGLPAGPLSPATGPLFVNQRQGAIPSGESAWSWPEIQAGVRSARSTAPTAVAPVGDESFGYDVYENRMTGRLEQSYVIIRVDSLVLEVGYTVVDGSKDGPAIQAGAHTAATWVANALNNQKAGE